MNTPIDHFIDGQQDCREGKPPRSQNADYQRGYGFEYHMQETKTHYSEQREKTK